VIHHIHQHVPTLHVSMRDGYCYYRIRIPALFGDILYFATVAVVVDDDTFSIFDGDKYIPNEPAHNFLSKERGREMEREKEVAWIVEEGERR
jgi:hypothetical protein